MNVLRAGARVMAQSETPENARQPKDDGGSDDKMKHQPQRLAERFDEQARGNVGDDHDRNDPTENDAEKPRINHIGVACDVEKIEIAVNQSLGAHDPKTDGGKTEHDRVMHGDA